MQQDRTLRQCPACGLLCKPDMDGQEVLAEMRCSECAAQFCFYHSNAHAGRPCDEYRREIAKEERMMARTALQGARPCPSCGIATDKASGCNHMTCSACQADWCWVCGRALDSVGWHYSPANPSGCQQFQDDEDVDSQSRMMRCLKVSMAPVAIVSYVLCGLCILVIPVWVILAVITLFPLLCCGLSLRDLVHCGVGMAFLPFCLFQLAWLVVAVLLSLFLCPCGSGWRTLQFLIFVPFTSVIALAEGVGLH
mmetsp:Transcript_47475/g.136491  ORF Transcript_47475/g.136491 Transcript_47475/m.136491 type:complete len:252 (+) Transcript_47475:3-758(+)